MKRLIEVKEDGLESLMGEKVILFCANYFYAGKLEGVSRTLVKLIDPAIVYETGDFSSKTWKDAQSMHVPELYVRLAMVESFARGK